MRQEMREIEQFLRRETTEAETVVLWQEDSDGVRRDTREMFMIADALRKVGKSCYAQIAWAPIFSGATQYHWTLQLIALKD